MNQSEREDDILSNLNKYYTHENLRPGQLEIINKILEKKDLLICKETGFGKSLCFQVAGLMQDGIVLVVSPLLARVEEKYQQLSGFPHVINSSHFLNFDNLPINIDVLQSVYIFLGKMCFFEQQHCW